MNILHFLSSTGKLWLISLERQLDHTYRKIRGVPTLSRSEITPQIYLGGQYSKAGFEILKSRGISGIVSMREHARKDLPDLGKVEFLHLPTKDMTAPTMEALHKGVAFITRHLASDGKVYVHCAAGEGRGPTMVAAYLISTGMTTEDALLSIKKVRRFIRPTRVQRQRLKEFEASVQTHDQ